MSHIGSSIFIKDGITGTFINIEQRIEAKKVCLKDWQVVSIDRQRLSEKMQNPTVWTSLEMIKIHRYKGSFKIKYYHAVSVNPKFGQLGVYQIKWFCKLRQMFYKGSVRENQRT